MEWYWWLLIVLVGGFVVYQLSMTFLGSSLKVGDAACFYLSAELKKMGIRHLIPDECVSEVALGVASTWSAMAKMDNKSSAWVKTEMIPILDSQAKLIVCWLHGDKEIRKFKELTATLEKYGVPCGAPPTKA